MNGPRRRAWQALTHARAALRRGDRAAARAWARRAVQLAPAWDVPWAVLGLLTRDPRARAAYLRHALRLNPRNARAAAALARTPAPPARRPRPSAVRARAPEPRARGPRPRGRGRAWWWVAAWAWAGALVLLALAGWSLAQNAAPADPSPRAGQVVTVSPTSWQPAPATATPTPSPTPTASPTPSPTPSPTATPTVTPAPSPTATALPWSRPPEVAPGERWILVDLSEQRLYALEGDRLVRAFVVSTGLPATPTVVGTFRIWIKLEAADMSGPGYFLPDVPYTMYFYKSYGIHGTYWHNNFGQPMSHGCVNMRTDEARWLFHWADVGTVVQVIP